MAPTLGFTLSFSDFGCLFGTHWRFVASTIFPKTLSLSLCVRFWQFSQYFHLFHYHLCYAHLSADLAEGVTDGRALQCALSFHQLLENTNETCCIDNEGHLLQESKADHTLVIPRPAQCWSVTARYEHGALPLPACLHPTNQQGQPAKLGPQGARAHSPDVPLQELNGHLWLPPWLLPDLGC